MFNEHQSSGGKSSNKQADCNGASAKWQVEAKLPKRFSRLKNLMEPVEITTEKAAQRITILEKKNCDKCQRGKLGKDWEKMKSE